MNLNFNDMTVGEAFSLVRTDTLSLTQLRALKREMCGYGGVLRSQANELTAVISNPETTRTPERKAARVALKSIRTKARDLRAAMNSRISTLQSVKTSGRDQKLEARLAFVDSKIAKYTAEQTKLRNLLLGNTEDAELES
jgi:hypothetical protein